MLELLGFEKTNVIYHYYLDKEGKKVFQYTVVGERTVPIDQCDYDYDDETNEVFRSYVEQDSDFFNLSSDSI